MRYLILIILLFFNSKILLAACPSGDDGQTVNILSGDSCTTRISNPQSTINVAGSLIVNSGDGAIYFNTGSHNLTITGTVKNTNTGTSHGIRDVATNVTSVTISGNGSVTGNVAGYYNEGSNVSLTTNQSNLVFKGKVPNTYEILIESSSDFGKTFFTPADISGTLGFSIGSDSSISTAGTYSSVLNNITSDNISSTRSGTFSTYNWVLEQSSPGSSTWDLVFTDSRTAYTTRISNVKLSEIATVLETINTNGSNATLTSNLDGLSEGELLKALRQIKGTTIQKSIGQSLRSNNKFNQAMISATSGPSFSQLVKNNFANLSFDDVQNFYNPEIEKVNLTNDFTLSDIANIFSKRNLLKIGSSEKSFYLRTFGGITDQEKVGDDVGYDSTTAGFVFGSYLDRKDSDIPGSVGIVVFFDTAIAILAGLVIFPALFAFGIEPNSGPGLLFVTMASLFKEIPFGMFLGGLFFFLVFIAAFTSIIGLLEAVISTAMDSFKISRIKSVILCVSLTFMLCVPNVLGFSTWSEYQIFGMSIFGFFDFLSAKILLPLGGLLISVYVAHVWGFNNFMEETNKGSAKLKVTHIWGPVMKFVIPIIILVILVYGLAGENLA